MLIMQYVDSAVILLWVGSDVGMKTLPPSVRMIMILYWQIGTIWWGYLVWQIRRIVGRLLILRVTVVCVMTVILLPLPSAFNAHILDANLLVHRWWGILVFVVRVCRDII